MKELVIQVTNRYYDFGYISRVEDFDAHLPLFEGCMKSLSFDDSTYVDTLSDISFSYPSGWAADDQSFEGIAMFYGPEVDGFITNVVFASEVWDGDVASFAENQKSQMTELLTGYRLLSDGTIALPAGICRDLTYSYEIPGPTEIKARAVMLCRGGMAYAMVYTALPEVFDAHLTQFDGMLATFSIVEGALSALMGISILAIGVLRDL
jgi:hypothetical protein